jgi:hypothetical protein
MLRGISLSVLFFERIKKWFLNQLLTLCKSSHQIQLRSTGQAEMARRMGYIAI